MDDIPQGGSGGVPGQHDSDFDDRQEHRSPEPDHQVKTVRAGAPVAEQKENRDLAEQDEQDDAEADRPD
ncbi:hypothetical protein OG871_37415 [Kitasatospora sp. NBC_00374]|uniref:hypothetical protein n=1 Tax=Kitasatospora sp. NBC_00374 TaxID=2975964 RepID=UPI00324D303C